MGIAAFSFLFSRKQNKIIELFLFNSQFHEQFHWKWQLQIGYFCTAFSNFIICAAFNPHRFPLALSKPTELKRERVFKGKMCGQIYFLTFIIVHKIRLLPKHTSLICSLHVQTCLKSQIINGFRAACGGEKKKEVEWEKKINKIIISHFSFG